MNTAPQRYIPEIDGLRAIAVLSVFLFHLDIMVGSGGFVGVDIFFVISGYLITGQIYRSLTDRSFSVLEFYARRIARIVPASFFVIAVSLFAGYWIFDAQDFAMLGLTGLLSSLSVVNLYLLLRGSYFAISPDSQPLMHYWSLAIEEQFYIFFPAILWAIVRFFPRRPIALLAVLGLLSFVACAAVTTFNPPMAFYLLPTRAWELLAGSVVALVQARGGRAPKYGAVWHGVGLALIFLSFALVDSAQFPGWIASIPVIGTALLLGNIEWGFAPLNRILASAPMNYVGKRSFSLYLWHWPVFSFIDYQFFLVDVKYRLVGKVVLSVLLTMLTYSCLENPARRWINRFGRPAVPLGLFVAMAAAICAAGYTIRSTYYYSARPQNLATGGIVVNSGGRHKIALVGDSTAAMYGYDLATLARRLDAQVNILGSSGNNELPGDEGSLWPEVEKYLRQDRPDLILVSQAWAFKIAEGEAGHRQFQTILTALQAYGAQVIVLTQPPIIPEGLTRQSDTVRTGKVVVEDPEYAVRRRQTDTLLSSFASDRVRVFVVDRYYKDADQSVKLIAPNGRLSYQDARHLSVSGTSMMKRDLEKDIVAALASGKAH